MQKALQQPGETSNQKLATRSLFAWLIVSALLLGFLIGWVVRAEPAVSAAATEADATATRAAELKELGELRTQVAEQATVCADKQPSPTPTQVPAGEVGQEFAYKDGWTVVVIDAVSVPGTDATKPSGAFLQVDLALTNNGRENEIFPFHELVLIDSQQRSYAISPTASRELIAQDWDFFVEPSQPTAKSVIFDVAPDAAPTIADVLGGQAKAKAATHGGVIPASPILAEVERSMSGKMGRELVLRTALKDVRKEHDLVLIDCPPALGLLTVNGLVAADWALVSSEAQYFALQAVEGALEVVEQAKEFYNPDLEFLGVVLNIADMRTKHSREALEQLKEHYGDKVFESVVRSSIAYAESAEKGVSRLDHRPDLGTDYLALADEVRRRVGLKEARKKLKPLLAA